MRPATLAAVPLVLAFMAAGPAGAADPARGAQVYRQHCIRCHGADGAGGWPGAPNFARREGLMQSDVALMQTLRKGRGVKPGYQGVLSDADILNVIAYTRTLGR